MPFFTPILILIIFLIIIIAYLIDRSGGWKQIRHSFLSDPVDLEGLISTVLVSFLLIVIVILVSVSSDIFLSELSWRQRILSFLSYLLAPISAVIIVMIAGAFFIKNIYELSHLRDALRYLLYSVFRLFLGMLRPHLIIDDGKLVLEEGKFNSLKVIGGPGDVIIQPGNAVIFRNLRKPSRPGITQDVALRRFETIGQIAVLDDEHEHIPELGADRELGFVVTRDGIRIVLKNIHYRYRIMSRGPQDPDSGRVRYLDRTLDDPYPFDLGALGRMANNRNVAEWGLQSVRYMVKLLVQTEIRNTMGKYTVDQLTAPKDNEIDVRSSIRDQVLDNVRTRNIGIRVFSLDLGHFEIPKTEVSTTRIGAWAAEWAGSADAIRARAEGTQMAMEDLGNAEAQMQFVFSIVSALKDTDLSETNAKYIIQTRLLTRTAKVFEAMRGNNLSPAENEDGKQKK